MEPQAGLCPGCHHALDAAVPDTAPELLDADLGVVESRIGEIRMGRTTLTGVLYATTRGLFFAPHHVERVVRVIGESVPGHSVLWWCASMMWSPLTLLLPFVKTRRGRLVESYQDRPQVLVKGDCHRMSQLLMQSPGCFFLSHQTLRLICKRRRKWIIERSVGGSLRFKPVSDTGEFERQFQLELSNDRWSGVIVSY
jgi:hypothetical protein